MQNLIDNSKLTKLFTKVGRIQFIILVLVLTGFVFLGKTFIRLWAGNSYISAYWVTILLIVPVTVPLIQNLGMEIQRAKNMHKARSVVYLFIAIANIFISIPLIKIMGAIGAALGTTISLFAGNIIFMNWYYYKRIGLDIIFFWKQILSLIPAMVIPCIVGSIIMNLSNDISMVSLIIYVIIYSIIYFVSMFLIGMNDEEKQLLLVL